MLQLRESQDERQLLGGNYRVLQDREESGQKETVLVVPDKDEVDIKSKRSFFKKTSVRKSLGIQHQEDSVVK